jgi:hypothetical protein
VCCCAIASCAISKTWIQTFVDSQQQIWIEFRKSPTPHIHIGFKSLRFGNRMEIEEVLQVEKNLVTEQRTRRRSRFVVQGGLLRRIERLSFTIWIYEKQKKQSSLPQSDSLQYETWKCSWIMMHYCAASCSGHRRRRLFAINPHSA